MASIGNMVENVKDAVQRATQSGTEPPSGVQGAGTIDRPYDQGNAPEQPSIYASSEPPSGVQGQGTLDSPYDQGNAPEQQKPVTQATEPPSGLLGKGTVDEPYDQGNQPEQHLSQKGTEPVSGVQGKGTLTQPYDQGNQPDQAASTGLPVRTALPSTEDPLASPSTTHQGSGNPDMAPTKEQEQIIHESRGRDEAVQRTTSTPDPEKKTSAPSGHFDAARAGAGQEASRLKYEERDVSPGEMRDGSHAVTSGEKGESYAPGRMNKLKDKFHIGRDRK